MGAACVSAANDGAEETADRVPRPQFKGRSPPTKAAGSQQRRQSVEQSPSLPSHQSSSGMEESHNLTFADSNGAPPRHPASFFDKHGSVDPRFSFPSQQQVGSLASEQEDEEVSDVSAASSAALRGGGGDGDNNKPAPLSNEDEDLLCDRDDDPPIVDDEPPTTFNPTAVFHSNAARHVHHRRVPNAPSLCYSARKSTVSFSESVSVHYDNPAHEDDCDDVDERATMTMHFDLEDDDELHHSSQGNEPPPPPLVTVAQPSPPRPPVVVHIAPNGVHSPMTAGDAVAAGSPAGPFAMSNATFSVRSQQQHRIGPRESDDASSVSAMLQQPTIFSDVSSVASSRGTIVTVRLGTDSASH
ncbi:Hypothetical protein, putative, partial [Bodo saltans]